VIDPPKETMMTKSTLISLSLWLALTGQALSDLPTARLQIPNADVVGEGRMKYLFWSVFDATLYAPNGVWSEDHPFALSLSYLRDLESSAIVDASIDEIRNQGMTDKATLDRWSRQMTEVFPDVDDKTTITGVVDQERNTIFYRNGELIGTIPDPVFSQFFFNIWLGEATSNPKLRSDLLGEAAL